MASHFPPPSRQKSVTHVSGTFCYLCLRPHKNQHFRCQLPHFCTNLVPTPWFRSCVGLRNSLNPLEAARGAWIRSLKSMPGREPIALAWTYVSPSRRLRVSMCARQALMSTAPRVLVGPVEQKNSGISRPPGRHSVCNAVWPAPPRRQSPPNRIPGSDTLSRMNSLM